VWDRLAEAYRRIYDFERDRKYKPLTAELSSLHDTPREMTAIIRRNPARKYHVDVGRWKVYQQTKKQLEQISVGRFWLYRLERIRLNSVAPIDSKKALHLDLLG
jgi:hypothetical protein